MKRITISILTLVLALGLGAGACAEPEDRDGPPVSTTLPVEMVPENDELVPTTDAG